MIIRRVHVRRFRKLQDQTIECGAGLNVIRGPNDAGKSTLHLAFSAAFFPSQPREVKSYGPWGDDHPGEITVEFHVDGEVFRLRKDFAARKIVLEGGREILDTPKLVEAKLAQMLGGLTSASLFRATLHVGQWDLAALEENMQREIGAKLSRIVTGGDSDGVRVLRQLEKYITEQEVGMSRPAKYPGPLKRENDEIARLTDLRARLGGEVQAVEQAAVERDRLAARCAEMDAKVREDEALADANRRLYELDRQCGTLTARAEELQGLLAQVSGASRDLAAAAAQVAAEDAAPAPAAVEALRTASEREKVRREALLEAEDAARQAREDAGAEAPPPARARPAWAAPAMLAAAAAGVVGLASMAGGRVSLGVVLLAAAAAGAATVGVALRAQAAGQARAAAAEVAMRARQRGEAAESVLATRRRDVDAAAAEVRRQLQSLRVSSLADALERAERAQQAIQRRESAQRLLDSLQRGRDREAIAKEAAQAVVELGAARAQRDDPALALKRLDAASYQRLTGDATQRRAELERTRAELQRLEGRLAGHSRYEELAGTEEQLTELQARFARRTRRLDALRLARDVLDAAHRETIVSGKAALEERASRYVRALSGGAYERVVVDEATLAPRVWVGPPKEWADVEAHEIGSGGVHQCYLALRFALVDLLCADRRPPLFLDDPFLAYDEDRQGAAMSFLRELARDRQIFLFTCRGAYNAYADQLIVLGGAQATPADRNETAARVPEGPAAVSGRDLGGASGG